MTKLRFPGTFEHGLSEIAGRIGWDTCGLICDGRSSSTIRSWADPDIANRMCIRDALRLDVEYQKEGGIGAPLLNSYAIRLAIELHDQTASREQVLQAASKASREAGEAIASLITASSDGATTHDYRVAMQEADDAVQALTGCIALLKSIGGR